MTNILSAGEKEIEFVVPQAWRSVVGTAVSLSLFAALAVGQSAPVQRGPTFAQLAGQAQQASEQNRLDEAGRLYARALALKPKWAEGWWALATLAYDQDHYAKAAAAFQKLLPLQPQNGTAQAMLGLCEFALGHDESALQHIEKGKQLGLQTNPELVQVVLYHEGLLLQRKGSFQAAQDILEDVCRRAGLQGDAMNILGMVMLRMASKNPPQPGSPDADVVAGIGRAECIAGQKKYEDAQAAFEQVIAKYPKYPNIHYAYGLFLLELRDVDKAVAQLREEIANHPDDVIARMRIAAAEYKQDSAAGIPYAEQAVKLAPQQPFAHYLLGLLRLDVDDYADAIPELEIAAKGLPHEPKRFFALGTAYSRAGRPQDAARARQTFQRLSAEAKKSAEAVPGDQSEPTRLPVPDAPYPQ